MKILAFDTETTGLVRSNDYTNPTNPFLASIAMILYDNEAHRIVSSFNAPVYPDGWAMPEEASAVNGLTTEYLLEVGLPAQTVIPTALVLFNKADLLVAHNVEFDCKVMAAALWRQAITEDSEESAHFVVQDWLKMPTFCTMQESKTLVGAMGKRGLKNPKLTEAYKHFFGKELDRAHSANADAVACLEIYLAIQAARQAADEAPDDVAL